MDALQNLFNRRSVRDFTAQPIEEEKLHRILEAGMSGPCCVNARDWSFIVVTDRENLLELSRLYIDYLRSGLPTRLLILPDDRPTQKDIEEEVAVVAERFALYVESRFALIHP